MNQNTPNKNQNDKAMLEEISLNKRSEYRKEILKISQIKGNQPKFYQKEYPKKGKFPYQEYQLNYGYIKNTNNPQALIFFFHGMYSHCQLSGYLSSVISSNVKNVNIYALDYKNAGFSQGDCPGYYTVEQIQDEAIKFIQFIENKFKDNKNRPKIFVMGQSLGGLLTFKLSVKFSQRFAGAVMFAPALRDCLEYIPYLKKLGRAIGYLFPRLKFIPQDIDGYTKYQNFQHTKFEEGRYLGAHPPGTAYSLLKHMDNCYKDFSKMAIPYLLIQGGKDKVVDIFAPIDLQKQSPSKDKTTIYYKQVWHDVLVEEQIKQIAQIVAKWFKKRV